MDKTAKTLAKEKFLAALEELPEERVKELLDFTESLLLREKAKKPESVLDPDKDPILRLIGSLDEEPFADKIDEELYGESHGGMELDPVAAAATCLKQWAKH